MPVLFLVFILIPLIEIAIFLQVGGILGLWPTLLIVVLTAFIGVKLLKQQGLKAWTDIQLRLASGRIPALEMASAAQLIFAGGLLLTPGFVTDSLGFCLMIPAVRLWVATRLITRWTAAAGSVHFSATTKEEHIVNSDKYQKTPHTRFEKQVGDGRTIDGEFEDRSG